MSETAIAPRIESEIPTQEVINILDERRGIAKLVEKSRYIKGAMGLAFGLEEGMDLANGLGIIKGDEMKYVTLLIAKELVADKQARRRHSGSEDVVELTDDLLLLSGSGGVNKKVIEDEKIFEHILNSRQEEIVSSSGEKREEMIRFAVHDLLSQALDKGRKTERNIQDVRKGAPKVFRNDIDWEKKTTYWKGQIANPPLPAEVMSSVDNQ